MFLTPLTRILTDTGTEVSCSMIMPPTFKINEAWLKFLPNPMPATEPIILKSYTKIS